MPSLPRRSPQLADEGAWLQFGQAAAAAEPVTLDLVDRAAASLELVCRRGTRVEVATRPGQALELVGRTSAAQVE
jgi:hypothetical protein